MPLLFRENPVRSAAGSISDFVITKYWFSDMVDATLFQ